MKTNNTITLFSISVILGFITGFIDAVIQVIANRYISYQMFRLIAFSFQKCLNKSVCISFGLVIILLLLLLLKRLIWKPLFSDAITIHITDENKVKLLLVCIACFILFFYSGWTINLWLPYVRFHPVSLLSDVGILLITMFLGWALIKLRWKQLFNNVITTKHKRNRTIALGLISFIVLINISIIIDNKINAPKGPNVIFICIDALRADHLGCYGYVRNTSPFIDQLAENGVMFSNVMSQSSWTKTSTAAFLTANYEMLNTVAENNSKLPSHANTLAEILRNHAYTTGAIVANLWLLPKFGFAQGFDYYNSRETSTVQRRIKEKTIIKYIEKNINKKFFLYIHFMDIHNPYRPPAPYDEMFTGNKGSYKYTNGIIGINKEDLDYTKGLYDGEIKFLDKKINNLFDYLKKQNLLDNTLIVINSDHGDEFLEHNGMGHGTTLYNELLRVPLLIINNDNINIKNSTIQSTVRNIDILPTILDILKISPITDIDGVSLMPLIEGKKELFSTGPVLASVVSTSTKHKLVSALKDRYKYIYDLTANTSELYNVLNDPEEKVNLIGTMLEMSENEEVLRLKKDLEKFIKTNSVSKDEKTDIDKKTMEQLKSLGYLQ